jgi:hypothetical protein
MGIAGVTDKKIHVFLSVIRAAGLSAFFLVRAVLLSYIADRLTSILDHARKTRKNTFGP